MFEYQIIEDENLLTAVATGPVSLDDLKGLVSFSEKKEIFTDGQDVVLDMRKGNLLLSLEEISNAAQILSLSYDRECRLAVLSDRSIDTAKLMLFRDCGFRKLKMDIFSSIEGAGEFLGRNLEPYFQETGSYREDLYAHSSV